MVCRYQMTIPEAGLTTSLLASDLVWETTTGGKSRFSASIVDCICSQEDYLPNDDDDERSGFNIQ